MRIITRKKGNKEYFYLQHSYREGGKSITREKYLGKIIPDDIEVIKSKFKKECNRQLYQKLESIKSQFQQEWEKLPKSMKEKELEEIAIAFTYNTNAIEGSTITLEETREIVHNRIAPNKELNEIKETEEHNKVFLKLLKKKEKLTKKLLLRWHEDVFKFTKEDVAGKFRDYLVRIGPYVAPDWQEVMGRMNEFVKFIDKNKQMNPVELSARAHYRFEIIHPFGDGNGRIGRLLMNHLLWHAGYPMLIIEYKKRASYYKAFTQDEEHFVTYYFRRYLSIHKKRIKL